VDAIAGNAGKGITAFPAQEGIQWVHQDRIRYGELVLRASQVLNNASSNSPPIPTRHATPAPSGLPLEALADLEGLLHPVSLRREPRTTIYGAAAKGRFGGDAFPADGDSPQHVLDRSLADVPYFPPAIRASAFDAARTERLLQEHGVLTIPSTAYKGYELRAYSSQTFPPHREPYAKGLRRFSSVVRIGKYGSSGAESQRYATQFTGADPTESVDVLAPAIPYGKDIIDGKVQATRL